MGLTKQELIERIYRKRGVSAGVTKKLVTEIVDCVFAELSDYFIKTPNKKLGKNGSTAAKFTYPGFGTFSKKKRGARSVRNPQTGEPLKIPPTNTLAFSVGSDLKSLLNEKR
jgi:nucleoid DNA-binding protein